ncbi:MAG TPA: hypothetical protein VLE43_08195 [Candidatus Saccharimonadia bacterium]|nr:hypothetical protein [Candidatus Saccharimonadia bacterium]
MNSIRFPALVMLFTACTSLACLAADPSNDFWYSVTINKGNTSETFTGSSQFAPDEFTSKVAAGVPVQLDNLRVEGLAPGDDDVKWHAVNDRTSVFIMPQAVLFYRTHLGDPLLAKRQAQATFRSVR